jgi:capsular exopolysaccharide synthesis family protein
MNKQFNLTEKASEQITDIKDYLFRILANWKWFVFAIIIALAIAYFFNISTQKIYGLKTTIAVKEKQNPLFATGTNIAFNWGGVSDKVENIRKTLTSRSHNEEVVKALKFYIGYFVDGKFRKEDIYGKNPFEIKLQSNQYQLLNKFITITFIDENNFTISTDFNVDNSYNLINYSDESIKNFKPKNDKVVKKYAFNEYINEPFLKAELIKKDLETKFKGKTFYIQLQSINQVTNKFKNVRAKGLTGTSLIEVSLTGANKHKLADFLNKTIEVLAKNQLQEKTNYARNTLKFIDEQFKNTSDSLKLIEDHIGKFKKQNDIYDLTAQGGEIFSQTTGLDKIQKELTDKIAYLKNLENYIKTHTNFAKIPAPAIINVDDAAIAEMVGELTKLSVKKEQLTNKVTANHPSLKIVKQEIETTRKVLLENISSLINTFNVSLNNSKKRLNSYNYELNKLPNKEQKLLNYQRKYSLTESNVVFLMQKRYEAAIAIEASVSDITVLDTAKDTGQSYILPRTSFNYMIALLLGIILPLFVIIALEIFENKINTAEDIERNSPIPILGVIGQNLAENNLAVFLKPKSTVAESFRALRSNIQFLFSRELRNKPKTILVTSSVSGEGKTFVSINMATVFALGGKKTILVGLDLRKPKIFGDFEITNKKGVVNFLIDDTDLSSIIQKTKIPNLDVITSGPVPPNPSELLIGDSMDELISKLKEKYEYIILDTPPIGLVSDAIELLRFTDTTIYVARHGYSQKGMLKMINEKYLKEEISNISIVLNDFKVKAKYGYSYGYAYGYGYGKYSNGYHVNEKKSIFKRWFKKKKS